MAFRRNEAWEPAFRKSPDFTRAMVSTSRELARYIKIAAEPSRNTGYYIRKITPLGGRVWLRDNFWHLVEYGSVNNPPYAPVRRGVLLAGMRFVDDGTSSVTSKLT